MSVLQGATNITIQGGNYTAVLSNTSTPNIGPGLLPLLLSHSAPAGLLDAAERFDAPRCDDGTRVSMLRAMKSFVQDGDTSSSPAVYWLHGPAGVGKSALAQSLALSLKDEGDHAASFFFSRTAPGRNNGNQLITTLAYQLATSIPALHPFMTDVVTKNPALLSASNSVKMQSLIVDPINEWQRRHKQSIWRWMDKFFNNGATSHPRLILVDGLDECDDPRVQQDLLLAIGLAVQQLSLPFRFVIASRPESHIMATFRLDSLFHGSSAVKVVTKNLGDDEDADEQITHFLIKSFAEIRRTHPIRDFLPQSWPSPDQIARLVSKSSKGFIYPTTVIRYIRMPDNRPDECLDRILGLSEIPVQDKPYEPLDGLYRYIFDSVPNAHKASIHEIFHFLVLPLANGLDRFVTPRLIEAHFGYQPGHVQLVLRNFLCILALSGHDEPITVLHASLPDFLLDKLRSQDLNIGLGHAHSTVAATFPLALSATDSQTLPDSRFVGFLEHIIQADFLDDAVYSRLVNIDFASRYCIPVFPLLFNTTYGDVSLKVKGYLRGAAFVTAYQLVLLAKHVRRKDIQRCIRKLRARVIEQSSFAACLHSVRLGFFPVIIPTLREWTASTNLNHGLIDQIITGEVAVPQHDVQDEILELYLLMLTPLFGVEVPVDRPLSQDAHPQSLEQQRTSMFNYISLVLLNSFFSQHCWNLLTIGLEVLTARLLEISLENAGYSAAVTAQLNLFLDSSRQDDLEKIARQMAPSITKYLERVNQEASSEKEQQQIRELKKAWSVCLT